MKETKLLKKTNNVEDFEKLLNATFPFVEDLLKKYGEFFPLVSAIDRTDSIVQVGTHSGDEHPLSDTVIADLKVGLKQGAQKGDYKAVAIFYDVRVLDPDTNQKTEAVAVIVENSTVAYNLFFSYELTKDNVLTFGKSWRNDTEKEIFIK